jgi:hypothetical protein
MASSESLTREGSWNFSFQKFTVSSCFLKLFFSKSAGFLMMNTHGISGKHIGCLVAQHELAKTQHELAKTEPKAGILQRRNMRNLLCLKNSLHETMLPSNNIPKGCSLNLALICPTVTHIIS